MIKQCVLDYSNTILPYASLKRGQVPLLSASEEPCLFFVLVLTTFLPQKVYVLCPPPPPGVTHSWVSGIILFALASGHGACKWQVFTCLSEQSGCTRVSSLQTPSDFPWGQHVPWLLGMLSLRWRRRERRSSFFQALKRLLISPFVASPFQEGSPLTLPGTLERKQLKAFLQT